MTEAVTLTEFELVVRGQAELRQDFKEMAKEHREDMKIISESQADLNGKFSTFLEVTNRLDQSVDEVKSVVYNPEDGLLKRMRSAESQQAVSTARNSDRWKLLGTFILSTVTIGSAFAAFIYWLVRTIPVSGV